MLEWLRSLRPRIDATLDLLRVGKRRHEEVLRRLGMLHAEVGEARRDLVRVEVKLDALNAMGGMTPADVGELKHRLRSVTDRLESITNQP